MRENDRRKFVELANKRVNSAIKTIRLIGNLSNRTNYSYEEDDVTKIFAALKREVREAEKRFSAGDRKGGEVFTLE
jgi:hypothetical protein